MLAGAALRLPRFATAAIAAALAVAAVALLTAAGDATSVAVHTLTFYAITAGAYVVLPFVRRGDVLMASVWLVLAAGVAPCVIGQEISAPFMFANMAGVLMAAAPIYIARLRQLAQGDTREARFRRQIEREGGLD